MNSADFITAKDVPASYSTSARSLDRAGVPNYRLTPRGKKLYRRSDIEAALQQNISSMAVGKSNLNAIVDQTVEEVLRGIV